MSQNINPWKIAFLPEPPKFIKVMGPSFIILGLGLGSGEIILWPYLVANFGLGIIWAAVIGVLFQFFINMEIERYALVRGESIFVGFTRMFRFLPVWFIFSTFLGFGWPGIIAASAQILGHITGIEDFKWIAILSLILIGVILTIGPTLYKTVEKFQKIILVTGIPSLIILTVLIAKKADYITLGQGLIGMGDKYTFIPDALPLLTFLGAFAFAGAGGNLNLSQSYYIKEKGFGMGRYASKIKSLLTGDKEVYVVEGTTFEISQTNIKNYKKWWRLINLEHFIIFFIGGSASILLLALLSYSTTHGATGNFTGINFIFNEGSRIMSLMGAQAAIIFFILLGVMLFATQLTVLDSTSRIISENLILLKPKDNSKNTAKFYYITLWLQIIFGISVFLVGFTDPKALVVTAAVINAFTMFVHIGLTYLLNTKTLPQDVLPSYPKRALILFIFTFFGVFSFYSIFINFFK